MLKTWKPPESVRIGPSQDMNACNPPSSRTTAAPGRSARWYVLASSIRLPASRRWSGVTPLTVPRVPTGMNAGVSTRPWGVHRTPARAAEPAASCARIWNDTGRGKVGLL